MIINNFHYRKRNIKFLSQKDYQLCCKFIESLVNNWINKNGKEWFSVSLLTRTFSHTGSWQNTPLQLIYNKYAGRKLKAPHNASAVAAGYLLQDVLWNMPINFNYRRNRTLQYQIV